jgi:CRP-like cAMP-binding protein
MAKSAAPDLSILSAAKSGLRYLKPNDWALIADKASRVRFKKGDYLMQSGKQPDGVYLLLKGSAQVRIPYRDKHPSLGPGEVCGEMSFLENGRASVSVVADEAVEAYLIDWATLQELFELFPHLGSRFYRSLATNLSRRLRDLIVPLLGH